MFLIVPSAFLIIYAVCSGVLPLKISYGWKILLGLVIVLAGLKYSIYTSGGGTWLSPSVSKEVMLVMEVAYGALVVLVFLLILKDIASIGLFLLRKWGVTILFSFNKNSFLFTLMGIALFSGLYGCWQAIKVPDVREQTITIKNLPAQWKGLKVVQLSDLHIGVVQSRDWLAQIVRKVNAVKPDLVLITGDFVDCRVSRELPDLEVLKELKSTYGTYAVPGNHEYYSGYQDWMKALRGLGVHMLENDSVVLVKDGAPLVIGGTTDFGASRFNMPSPDLQRTFEGTPAEAVRILMAHQPKTTYRSNERFELQLSGHTHGGHLLFMYPLVGYFNDGLVFGLYERNGRQIYVNRGTGLWNGFSMRLGVPSEITLVKLEN